MITKEVVSVEYSKIADGTELIARDAQNELCHVGQMCTVLRHRVSTQVEYLVETPNGERRWVPENDE